MKPLIEIRDLNHYYGKESLKKQILFGINLDIDAGEIVLLTGPSGSGKTTLLSLIGGLRSVQEGSLRTVDTELNGANESLLVAVRRHTGYIFQAHNLLPFMTARQNVQMSVELHEKVSAEEAHARSTAALQAVGLGQHTHYYPDKLSGGQKQRVAIARALVNRPKLILADEPTAALDGHTGREVVNLMQQMAREQNCTILLVTHDNRILDIADRIVHLEDGKLQQDAKIQSKVLVTSPQYASQNGQKTVNLTVPETVVETVVAPDTFSIPERFKHIPAEAKPITHTPEGETEPGDAQNLASDADQLERNYDLKPQFKADETTSTELTVVEPTVEATVSRWHDRLPASELDRIVDEVTQEDFQMYVEWFSLRATDGLSPTELYTIACIDDSPAILEVLNSFLSDALFAVVLISDPIKALTELIRVKPNLIILDITMPRLNGYQLCELLRRHKYFKDIPVIFITGDRRAFNPKEAQKVGVKDCLIKPFNQSDLIVKLFPYLV